MQQETKRTQGCSNAQCCKGSNDGNAICTVCKYMEREWNHHIQHTYNRDKKGVVLGTMLVHGKLRNRTAEQLRACVVNIIQGVGSHGRPMVSEEIRTQVCAVRG